MQNVVAAALLHGVDQYVAQVFAALGAHHVLHVDPAAGMVGDLIRPDAVGGDARQIPGLVLVELVVVHHAQAVGLGIGTGLEVIEDAQRGVDLPDVVRMTAG